MTDTTELPSFFLSIQDDQMWITEYACAGERRLWERVEEHVVSSANDLHQFLNRRAKELGVTRDDLSVCATSSVDFVEGETDNAATIALAHEIRDPDWDRFLGPKNDEVLKLAQKIADEAQKLTNSPMLGMWALVHCIVTLADCMGLSLEDVKKSIDVTHAAERDLCESNERHA